MKGMKHKKIISICLSGALMIGTAVSAFANKYDSCAPSGNRIDTGNKAIPGVDYFRYYPDSYQLDKYRALTPIEVVATEKHSGSQALKVGFLKDRELDDYIAFSMSSVQEEDLEEGFYVWSFWAKTEGMDQGTSTNYAWLTNERDNSSWEIFRKTPAEVDEATGWSRYEMRFHISDPKNGAWGEYPYMKLAAEFNCRGTAYFDDMELYRVPAQDAVITDEAAVKIELENGGFEKTVQGEHAEIREDAAPLWTVLRHYDSSEFTQEQYKSLTPVHTDSSAVYSGNNSLKIEFSKNRNQYGVLDDYIGVMSQSIKCLKKGQVYTLSFWMKNDGVTNENAVLAYLGKAYAAKSLKNDGTWQEASWEILKNTPYESKDKWDHYIFQYQPEETFGGMWGEESELEFELHDKGAVYIDEVVLNEGDSGAAIEANQNLLVNGDFEMNSIADEPYTSIQKINSAWSSMTHFNSGVYSEEYFNTTANAQITTEIKHGGKYGLKIGFLHKNEANSFMGICAQLKENLKAGVYKLSLWAYRDDSIQDGEETVALPRMKNNNVSIDNGEKWELFQNKPVETEGDWKKYEFFFHITEENLNDQAYPTNSSIQNFWIESKGRGVYYLDDVMLTYGEETKNLIKNGDFEPVYEDEEMEITEFSEKKIAGSIGEFSVTVKNKTNHEIAMPILFAADYSNGQMIQLKQSGVKMIAPEDTQTVKLQVSFSKTAKGMLWRTQNSMHPLCESVTLQ